MKTALSILTLVLSSSVLAQPAPGAIANLPTAVVYLAIHVISGGFIGLTPPAPALEPPDTKMPKEFVATRERPISTSEGAFMQIHFEGADYFVKTRRPGSAFTEVHCRPPANEPEPSVFAAARRPGEFVKMLKAGCAVTEQRGFLFEQKLNSSISSSSPRSSPPSPVGYAIFTLLGSPLWVLF